MSTSVQVEYPSESAFSGSAQVNMGPFFISDVVKLLRHEVRGQVNFQAESVEDTIVIANLGLWAVQWVPTGNSPSDIVTTVDGPQFPIRQQMGTADLISTWAPTADAAALMVSYGLVASWGGQLPVGRSIDLYLSVKPPSGTGLGNANLFASLRTWWS